MTQNNAANFFTFSDDSGDIQITYYPHAPGSLTQGQNNSGPQLEYQGSEGNFVYPSGEPGRDHINVEEQSVLGPHINVVLVPTIDAKAVTLTLLLPPINLAGQDEQAFETVAIKTTSYGTLPRAGARLTYEAINLQGTAKNVALPS